MAYLAALVLDFEQVLVHRVVGPEDSLVEGGMAAEDNKVAGLDMVVEDNKVVDLDMVADLDMVVGDRVVVGMDFWDLTFL